VGVAVGKKVLSPVVSVGVAVGGSSVSGVGVPVGVAVGMGGVPSCADTDGKVRAKLTNKNIATSKIHHLLRLVLSFIQFLHRCFYIYKSKHLNHVIYG
jgi:hypothetical protein